jgi:hypothetical protein
MKCSSAQDGLAHSNEFLILILLRPLPTRVHCTRLSRLGNSILATQYGHIELQIITSENETHPNVRNAHASTNIVIDNDIVIFGSTTVHYVGIPANCRYCWYLGTHPAGTIPIEFVHVINTTSFCRLLRTVLYLR